MPTRNKHTALATPPGTPGHVRQSANWRPSTAAALAMDFYIKLDARVAKRFSITATGRDDEICGQLQDHLILKTYREVLESADVPLIPLSIKIANDIPTSARVVVPRRPLGWQASQWRCTLVVCAGPMRKLSARRHAASIIPTTHPPAGWAVLQSRMYGAKDDTTQRSPGGLHPPQGSSRCYWPSRCERSLSTEEARRALYTYSRGAR